MKWPQPVISMVTPYGWIDMTWHRASDWMKHLVSYFYLQFWKNVGMCRHIQVTLWLQEINFLNQLLNKIKHVSVSRNIYTSKIRCNWDDTTKCIKKERLLKRQEPTKMYSIRNPFPSLSGRSFGQICQIWIKWINKVQLKWLRHLKYTVIHNPKMWGLFTSFIWPSCTVMHKH